VKKQAITQSVQKSRRKLLTAMSVGVAAKLPDLWSKPAVASVVLPAHASSTTPACDSVLLSFSARTNDGTSSYYTYTLTADALGLPNSPSFNANFTFYNIGNMTQTTVTALQSIGPGMHRATVPIEVVFTAACSPFSVNVYPVGTPGNIVCDDQTQYCALIDL